MVLKIFQFFLFVAQQIDNQKINYFYVKNIGGVSAPPNLQLCL
jgi:hypothetical protein